MNFEVGYLAYRERFGKGDKEIVLITSYHIDYDKSGGNTFGGYLVSGGIDGPGFDNGYYTGIWSKDMFKTREATNSELLKYIVFVKNEYLRDRLKALLKSRL